MRQAISTTITLSLSLENSNKEAIDALKENRDKTTYRASELSKKAVNKKDEKIIIK